MRPICVPDPEREANIAPPTAQRVWDAGEMWDSHSCAACGQNADVPRHSEGAKMTSRQFVDLVASLAWPMVALLGIILLRKPLGELVKEFGKRATKFSLFQFAVELSTVQELAPSWNVPTGDVRQLTRADVFDSATMSLFEELSSAGASDYIVVDLGSGRQWLTSRLYIFALILRRMRGMRCVVFTANKQEATGAFVGLAEPAQVRWSLAAAYPWLESAFAKAYAQVAPSQPAPGTRFIVSEEGALDPMTANRLVREFLTHIQFTPAAPLPVGVAAPAVPPQPPEWTELSSPPPGPPQIWEHASWLDLTTLEQTLGRNLRRDLFEDSPDLPAEERTRAIARRPGLFVPLVAQGHRFNGLIDRQALLEAIAHAYGEAKSSEK